MFTGRNQLSGLAPPGSNTADFSYGNESVCVGVRQVRPGLAGWLTHSHYREALRCTNELHLDGGLASGLPNFRSHLLPLHSTQQ